MRTLLIVFIGLLVLVAVLLSNRLAARRQAVRMPAEDDPSLSARLTEAATAFSAAAEALPDDRAALGIALSDLASQCDALAERAPLPRTARGAVVRLLLALHGVVERVTKLAQRAPSDAFDPLIDSATGLIVGASEALHGIAEQADETAMRHLEADLDVLRARLDAHE